MSRAPYLVTALLGILASRGMTADTVDPWRGWIAFKHYARVVDEIPDPRVSVQFAPQRHGSGSLLYVRQVVDPRDNWLAPLGAVICELHFEPARTKPSAWEFWSFDCRSFERFVDRVEQFPPFAGLMVRRAEWSAVYWEDAGPDDGPLAAA